MSNTGRLKGRLGRCTAMLSLTLLAACGGGGGGGGPISTPPPAPAPAPAPTPTPAPAPAPAPSPASNSGMPPVAPVPTQFNTAEFRRSDGPEAHNAATAWNAGN